MICPVCGNNVPDGTPVCPVCNSPLTAPQGGAPDQGFAPQDQGFGAAPAPQGGSKGPLIAIIAVVALLVVGAVIFFLVKGGGNKDRDGRYESNYMGMITIYIELDGTKGTFGMTVNDDYKELVGDMDEKYECQAKWEGDTLKLTVDGDTLECNYNKSDKTIVIPADSALEMGEELVFTKVK